MDNSIYLYYIFLLYEINKYIYIIFLLLQDINKYICIQ